MAAAPLLRLFPALFRLPWANGCSHRKVPTEAPIELLTARPPVASGEGNERSMQRDLTSSGPFGSMEEPSWQSQGTMDSRPG